MKLLVSSIDVHEARLAWEGGADIIDIKNPSEGSLGANYPWVIKEAKEILPGHLELSATIGDLENRPGTASQAAYGLSTMGLDYIKAGFLVHKPQRAIDLAQAIVKATEDSESKVVLAGYGDYKTIGSISPLKLVDVALASGASVIMVDTFKKNGNTLFDHMTAGELHSFVDLGKEQGLRVALAGSIKPHHLPLLKEISPHIIGVRGAVCTGFDRDQGKIEREKVKEFKEKMIK